ncbi:MAG: DUF1508 domain-containing protein [Bacteroidota bacterium]
MRFELSKQATDQLFYFQIFNDDNQVILNSEGYQSEEQCGRDAAWTMANYNNEDFYIVREVDGNFALNVQNEDQQTIAQSTYYSSQAALRDDFTFVDDVQTIEGTPYQGRGGEDDYEPLSFYQANITGVENGFDTFSADRGHFFTYNLNGRVILISESYTSTRGRDNGVESVKKNLPIIERYQRRRHPNGKYYFNLLAGNRQEIATSIWFDGEGDIDIVIAAMSGQNVGDIEITVIEGEERTGELVAANRNASIGIAAAPAPDPVDENKPKKKRKKRKKSDKPKAEKVIVAESSYLFNDIDYQIFRSGNNKYYFTFKNKEGKTVLMNSNVRGFETQEQAQAVVDQILEFGPYEENFEGKTTKNGKYYFYLKDGDGGNIGKSFFFDTTEQLQESVGLFLGTATVNQAAIAAARLRVAEEEAAAEEARLAAEEAKRKEEEAAAQKRVLRTDDYLPCKAYAGEAGFHKFFDIDQKEYFFAYNDENGNTLLRSEGYTTERARDNGIESVKKNAPLEERWSTDTAVNDKYHFYILKAGNHQEIARSCYYDSNVAMMTAFGAVTGEKSNIGFGSKEVGGVLMSAFAIKEAEAQQAAEARRAALRTDDYLPCDAYAGDAGFYKFYNEERKEYYFAYNDENGKTLLRSEGYTTATARDNGVQSVIKNAPIEERWKKDTALNGKYHFYILKAGNHQEIARSCYYDSEAAMMLAFGAVTGEDSSIGFGSAMVGGALMSALALSREKEEEAALEAARVKEEEERRAAALAAAKIEEEAQAAAAALAAKQQKEKEEAEAEALAAAKLKVEEEAKKKAEEAAATERKAAAAAAATAAAAALAAAKLKEEEEKAAAAALAAAAATTASTPPPKVVTTSETPPTASAGGGDKAGAGAVGSGCLNWRWLLLALLLLLLLFFLLRGCLGEKDRESAIIGDTDNTETSVVPEEQDTTMIGEVSGEVEGEGEGQIEEGMATGEGTEEGEGEAKQEEADSEGEFEEKGVPEGQSQITSLSVPDCNCGNAAIFQFEGSPRSINKLGSLPEFGNSHGLTPSQFYEKLQDRYNNSIMDRNYLNYVFRAMGYSNGFSDASADLFSDATMESGTKGNLGFAPYHGYKYYTLNTSGRDLLAFRIKARNGCDIHYMKTCGNYFYFCE